VELGFSGRLPLIMLASLGDATGGGGCRRWRR